MTWELHHLGPAKWNPPQTRHGDKLCSSPGGCEAQGHAAVQRMRQVTELPRLTGPVVGATERAERCPQTEKHDARHHSNRDVR